MKAVLALLATLCACQPTVCDTTVLEDALQTDVEVAHAEAFELPPEIPGMGWFRPDDPRGCLLRYQAQGVQRLAVALPEGKDAIRVHPLEGAGPARATLLLATSQRRPQLLVSHRLRMANRHLLQVDLYALGEDGGVRRESFQVTGRRQPIMRPPTYVKSASTQKGARDIRLRVDADGVARYWCTGRRRPLAPCTAIAPSAGPD
jgi:hypothetical protein